MLVSYHTSLTLGSNLEGVGSPMKSSAASFLLIPSSPLQRCAGCNNYFKHLALNIRVSTKNSPRNSVSSRAATLITFLGKGRTVRRSARVLRRFDRFEILRRQLTYSGV